MPTMNVANNRKTLLLATAPEKSTGRSQTAIRPANRANGGLSQEVQMQRRTKRIIGAIVVIAAIAAGGAAFTAGNTVPDTVAGYGTSNITGATVTALHYTLDADGTHITDAALTFQGDQTGNVVKAGFGTDALTTCTLGSYDSGTDTTPASCTGYTQSTATSATFNVAVTNS
jgi:hypothetical protein